MTGPAQLTPVFIIYKSRSGSTYIADLLARHPAVAIAPESNLVPNTLDFVKREQVTSIDRGNLPLVLDVILAEPKFRAWGLEKEEWLFHLQDMLPLDPNRFLAELILTYCRLKNDQLTVWGLKKGGWYNRNIVLLRKIFPDIRLIHIVRDGRAVYASSKIAVHTDKGRPLETCVRESAFKWKSYVNDFDKYRAEDCLEVRYEDFILNPESGLRGLLTFLGLSRDEDVLEYLLRPHETTFVHPRFAHLHTRVGADPDPTRISAWKGELDERDVRAFERIAGPELRSKGYELEYRVNPTDSALALFDNAKIRLAKLKSDLLRMRRFSS
jgi:hypothetical protein